jgi:hypothetical protein
VLGLPPSATGIHAVGKGYVLYESQSPAPMAETGSTTLCNALPSRPTYL